MAAIDWPWNLVTILLAGFEYQPDPDVERTSFEDGSIRQATIRTRSYDVRRFEFVVMASNYDAFDAWLRANSNELINFRDPTDKVVRDVRIRGGRASVSLRAVEGQRLRRERFWRGSIELEGYM